MVLHVRVWHPLFSYNSLFMYPHPSMCTLVPHTHSHVILGFSRSGNHMISYQYEIDGDATSYSQHKYTLHWWWFDLHKPLRHVRALHMPLLKFLILSVCLVL